MTPRAVIFDLDGTLIDSAGDSASILNAVLKDEAVAPFSSEEVEVLMGGGISATIDKALKARGRPASTARIDQLHSAYLRLYTDAPVVMTKPYPHARDVLARLVEKGMSIGICTNKAERPARLILEQTGLSQHISAIVGGDSGFGLKPQAGPLQACAGMLNTPLDDVMYGGDLPIDVATARAAGSRVFLVRYGYAKIDTTKLGADFTIGCLSELPSVLGEYRNQSC